MENQLLSRHDDFVMGVRYLFQNDLREFNFDSDLTSNPSWVEPVQNHIDLPRIREGRLGGQVIPFFDRVGTTAVIFINISFYF